MADLFYKRCRELICKNRGSNALLRYVAAKRLNTSSLTTEATEIV